jgi:hypothetical protein
MNDITKDARFKELYKKYGIAPDRAAELFQRNFADGGTKFRAHQSTNPFAEVFTQRGKQRSTATGLYGEVSAENAPKVFEELRKQFPKMFESSFIKGEDYTEDENGNITSVLLTQGTNGNPKVKKFQEEANKELKAAYEYAVKNNIASEEDVSVLKSRLDNNLLTEDGRLGANTASISNNMFDVLTKEDLEKLSAKGIRSFGQLKGVSPEELSELGLSDVSTNNLKNFSDYEGDFLLGSGEFNAANVDAEVTTTDTTDTSHNKYEPIKANTKGVMPLLPSADIIPPTALEPAMLAKIRLETLDPVERTDDPFIQNQSDTLNFAKKFLNNLPFAQNKAIFANYLASAEQNTNTQLAENQDVNNRERQRVDAANAEIRAKEDSANNQYNLAFEQTQLRGKANTDADLFNYFETLRRDRIGRFNTRHSMALIDQQYDNYSFDEYGLVQYNPDGTPVFHNKNTNTGKPNTTSGESLPLISYPNSNQA